jgi:hypothetical protein
VPDLLGGSTRTDTSGQSAVAGVSVRRPNGITLPDSSGNMEGAAGASDTFGADPPVAIRIFV